MGGMCVQPTKKTYDHFDYFANKPKIQKSKAESHPYADLLREYMKHYGQTADHSTQQFIQKNYHHDYHSTMILKDGSRIYTYKYQLIKRFQEAKDNRYRTYKLNYVAVNQQLQTLEYQWTVQMPRKGDVGYTHIRYNCKARFKQNQFYEIQLKEHVEPSRHYIPLRGDQREKERSRQVALDMHYEQQSRKRQNQEIAAYNFRIRDAQLQRLFKS